MAVGSLKWQTVNKHINELKRWRVNRQRSKLEVKTLDAAIELAEEHLRCKGFERVPDTNAARAIFPGMSVGLLEQVQYTLSVCVTPAPKDWSSLDVATENIKRLIEEAKRVNAFRIDEAVPEVETVR